MSNWVFFKNTKWHYCMCVTIEKAYWASFSMVQCDTIDNVSRCSLTLNF